MDLLVYFKVWSCFCYLEENHYFFFNIVTRKQKHVLQLGWGTVLRMMDKVKAKPHLCQWLEIQAQYISFILSNRDWHNGFDRILLKIIFYFFILFMDAPRSPWLIRCSELLSSIVTNTTSFVDIGCVMTDCHSFSYRWVCDWSIFDNRELLRELHGEAVSGKFPFITFLSNFGALLLPHMK